MCRWTEGSWLDLEWTPDPCWPISYFFLGIKSWEWATSCQSLREAGTEESKLKSSGATIMRESRHCPSARGERWNECHGHGRHEDMWPQRQTVGAVLWVTTACWFLVQVPCDALKPGAAICEMLLCLSSRFVCLFALVKLVPVGFSYLHLRELQIKQGVTIKRHEKILAGRGRGESGGFHIHCLI